MATKTFYFKNAVPTGATLHRSLQDGGTAPTAATTTTGWVNGTNAAGQSCIQTGGTEYSRTGGNWGTTLQPSAAPSQTIGDTWRSENTLSGTFANTDWTFNWKVRSVTAAYTGRFRLAVRVWASTDANGASARELTAGRVTSSATTASLTTSADTSVTITWSPGSAEPLTGEYLFVQVGIEITTAGGGNTQDVDFRVGSTATVVTPDFVVSQAVSPNLLTNTSTLYQPAVTPGAVTISPDLLTNTSTVYEPEVIGAAGGQSIAPELLANASTVYQPAIEPGPVTISPDLLESISTVFQPAVAPGAVVIAPSLLTNTSTVFDPSIGVGASTIEPSLLANTSTVFNPAVVPGPVEVLPSLATNTSAVFPPSVSTGATSVSPGLVTNTSQVFAPEVSPGPVGVAPSLLTSASTVYEPAVALGPTVVYPTLVVNAAQVFLPAVAPGPVSITPSLVVNASTVFVVTVEPGAITITPQRISSTGQVFEPGVVPGPVNVSPELIANANSVFAPALESAQDYILTYAQAKRLYQIYLLHGLKDGAPLTIEQNQRLAGGIEQAITEGGGVVTITTGALPMGVGVEPGVMVDELAALHGLTVALSVTSVSRIAGSVSQAMASVSGVTTVVRL